jgi:hypothetical protein
MGETVNLINDADTIIDTSKDNVVIVDVFASIRGGRSLDVTGFPENVIKAGHVIIQETATGTLKPMPLAVAGGIAELGAHVAGSGYTNAGTYSNVSLTGGSGSGAKATFVVAAGAVASVTITTPGTGYKAGDILSAAAANIGTGGSGFQVAVVTVNGATTGYASSLPDGHTYAGILIASILAKKPFAGVLVQGTVNPAAAPYSMTSILAGVKTALPLIDFRED